MKIGQRIKYDVESPWPPECGHFEGVITGIEDDGIHYRVTRDGVPSQCIVRKEGTRFVAGQGFTAPKPGTPWK
jgi:hypothetical protein